MAEWSNALAWKASILKGIAGSNPVLSAKLEKSEKTDTNSETRAGVYPK